MSNILESKAKYLSKRRYGGLREAILARDNNQCQTCSSLDNIIVHHKDENVKNNTLENLIILCAFCHLKIHHKFIIDETKTKEILQLRKENWSYQKIANKFGVTRQRVHQIVKKLST